MKNGKSIQEITDIIVKFQEDRNWKNDNPSHLISSILIELGELAEHYQWENYFDEWDEAKKEEVGYEFVDVIFYLFNLARKSGIDIEEYFDKKVPKLEKKFPVGQTKEEYKKVKKDYRNSGKNKLYE